MPELPEVETIVRSLREPQQDAEGIIGERITGAKVLWEGTLANLTSRTFIRRIKGQSLREIGRRGKFLVFSLSTDSLLIHLRMSGDLRIEKVNDSEGKKSPLLKHDRLALTFENNAWLVFNNPRKFGRVWLLKDPGEVLNDLGPEPLSEALTGKEFHLMLTSRSRQLKPLLMDQRFLAGLGNIYTDEALFRVKIHPLSRSDSLTESKSVMLLKAIREVLEDGIHRNGASIDWVYRGGDFQNHFNVYGRKGDPCPKCGTPIERLLVGQRGTHICPNCQKR